jgi:precorrin-2 dehydrogenase/sirohydrochlorin ferrochelatase
MEYPVFLHIRNRLCIVVGGGSVGRRKAEGLAEVGARVRLIDPTPFSTGKEPPELEILRREYRSGDLRGAFLAFAATDDRAVNAAVAEEARREDIPVNVVDAPEEGDFSLPARFRRGDLTVAVSTNGKSPAFAVLVKEHLAGIVGDEWAVFLEIASAIRGRMEVAGRTPQAPGEVFSRLLKKDLPGLISCKNIRAIDAVLEEILGPDFSLDGLGVSVFTPDI